ncbi:MAG: excinuclease ABC subunit C, partial [Halieaceae bacterium]
MPVTEFDHKTFLAELTTRTGVYQMYGENGALLYVGKAKNLRSRVTSYFRASGLTNKTMALVAKIQDIQVTVTGTETEALLLEHNLIKEHRPAYNILLKDDKSYPYIHVSSLHEFPRIALHRGAKKVKGDYFGPFPSAGAVRESIQFLQKVFQVRPCEDTFFKNRSRPCLQHQIGRCTAPCVGKVSAEDYAAQLSHATLFLQGKSRELLDELADDMEAAANSLEFERAAFVRDQIVYLQKMQSEQSIEGVRGDVDIVSAALDGGRCCVQLLFVRSGRILGSRSFYPSPRLATTVAEVISAFLSQHYLGGTVTPREIIVNAEPEGVAALAEVLTERAGHAVRLSHRVRSSKAKWLALAEQTAEENLRSVLAASDNYSERITLLQRELRLNQPPQRMECFDISHSSGEATVASCVVFDGNGP